MPHAAPSNPNEVTSGSFSAEEGRQQEMRLILEARTGNSEAMEDLIGRHSRLITLVARRYRCRSHSQDDLYQEGVIGFLTAIERFDPQIGCRLSTYALHWIRQSIARAVERKDRIIHIPARATSEMRALERARQQWQARHCREATSHDLADETGLTEERIERLLLALQETVSLEQVLGGDIESGLPEMAADSSLHDPAEKLINDWRLNELWSGMEQLRPRELSILCARFGLDGAPPRTLDELGRTYGLSREGVRQVEVRALRKLRQALNTG